MSFLLAVLRHRWFCRPPCKGHAYLSRAWPGDPRTVTRYHA